MLSNPVVFDTKGHAFNLYDLNTTYSDRYKMKTKVMDRVKKEKQELMNLLNVVTEEKYITRDEFEV